jgi:hypothetical protein
MNRWRHSSSTRAASWSNTTTATDSRGMRSTNHVPEVLEHRPGKDPRRRARIGAGELPYRLLQRSDTGLADRGGLKRPSQAPRLRVGGQLRAHALVAEQLGAGLPERSGQQVAVEVVRLLVVVHPAADERDQALGLGQRRAGRVPAQLARQPGGRPALRPEGASEAVRGGHGAHLLRASAGASSRSNSSA